MNQPQPPSPVQAVLELFQGPLAEVRFADVDAARLFELATAVDTATAVVAEQEAQLAELRQGLADRQEALLVFAQRALAYARVYAEHDEALSEQLSRITLPRATKPRKASPKSLSADPSTSSSDPASTPAPERSVEAAESAEAAEAAEAADRAEHSERLAEEHAGDLRAGAEVVEAPPRKGKRRSGSAREDAAGSVENSP